MIERKFVQQNLKEHEVKNFMFRELTNAGLSEVKLERTPVGTKIIVRASRPGLVVGKGGSNIKKLTKKLKGEFDFDDPQIEIEEVDDPRGDAEIASEMIKNTMERYGPTRFKGVGHKTLNGIMDSGAMGAEILITGKVPSSRSRRWRFYQGYLKKCGDVAVDQIDTAYKIAKLRNGTVGVQVRIMPEDVKLPDQLEVAEEPQLEEEDVSEEEAEKKVEELEQKAEDSNNEDDSKSDEE